MGERVIALLDLHQICARVFKEACHCSLDLCAIKTAAFSSHSIARKIGGMQSRHWPRKFVLNTVPWEISFSEGGGGALRGGCGVRGASLGRSISTD